MASGGPSTIIPEVAPRRGAHSRPASQPFADALDLTECRCPAGASTPGAKRQTRVNFLSGALGRALRLETLGTRDPKGSDRVVVGTGKGSSLLTSPFPIPNSPFPNAEHPMKAVRLALVFAGGMLVCSPSSPALAQSKSADGLPL